MTEWIDQYNPFNSTKVLMWREWMEGFAKRDFLPPVTICVDPTSKCSLLKCVWCNSADYNKTKEVLSGDHLHKIVDFSVEWGVKSVHIFGGGEPTENPNIQYFILYARERGLEIGLISNGLLMTHTLIDAIARSCRWVGLSFDAGSPETYMKVKGTDNPTLFHRLLTGTEELCSRIDQLGTNCSVCAKYLIHPINVGDIYKAAEIAKELGVDSIQIRPAAWENIANQGITPFNFDGLLEEVDYQIDKALSLESETFHVYGIRHKFSPSMSKKRNYSRCWASPITVLFGADGNCYICGDRRGQKNSILCTHYPDIQEVKKWWNSDRHRQLLDSVDLDKCPRCVVGPYHEMVEKVFIKDQMCRMFP